jgi:hypothetical protein
MADFNNSILHQPGKNRHQNSLPRRYVILLSKVKPVRYVPSSHEGSFQKEKLGGNRWSGCTMLRHSLGPFLCNQLLLIVLRPRTWFFTAGKAVPCSPRQYGTSASIPPFGQFCTYSRLFQPVSRACIALSDKGGQESHESYCLLDQHRPTVLGGRGQYCRRLSAHERGMVLAPPQCTMHRRLRTTNGGGQRYQSSSCEACQMDTIFMRTR